MLTKIDHNETLPAFQFLYEDSSLVTNPISRAVKLIIEPTTHNCNTDMFGLIAMPAIGPKLMIL